mgnify:CR=1 FL=1
MDFHNKRAGHCNYEVSEINPGDFILIKNQTQIESMYSYTRKRLCSACCSIKNMQGDSEGCTQTEGAYRGYEI